MDVGGNSAGILFNRWIVDSFGASRQGGKALMHAEYPLAASDLDSICQVQIGASSWELFYPPTFGITFMRDFMPSLCFGDLRLSCLLDNRSPNINVVIE